MKIKSMALAVMACFLIFISMSCICACDDTHITNTRDVDDIIVDDVIDDSINDIDGGSAAADASSVDIDDVDDIIVDDVIDDSINDIDGGSAADAADAGSDTASDSASIDINDGDSIIKNRTNDLPKYNNAPISNVKEGQSSFKDVQNLIDDLPAGSVLYLSKGYTMQDKESPITIRNNITIDGNGHTLNADEKGIIFEILGGNVVLSNFILTKGKASKNGGAIYLISGISLKCDNIIFSNNYAACEGGAVFISSSISSTFTNCTFKDNRADSMAGALCSYGKLTCRNCDFSDNIATNNYGGAIHTDTALTCINCDFSNNYAGSIGGAIQSTDVHVENCIFLHNHAGQSFGGAISSSDYVYSANCDFTNNYAGSKGGAIYAYTSLTVINSTFNDNSADDEGGACFTRFQLLSTNSSFNRNSANRGGAIYSEEETECVNSSFNRNSALSGGAIFSWGDVFIERNGKGITVFNSNIASTNLGGGIVAENKLYVRNTTFLNNYAKSCGGAVYVQIQCNIYDSIFDKNTIANSSLSFGGAVYSEGLATIESSQFSGSTTGGRGGAIYAENVLNLIGDNEFSESVAYALGGAIYSQEDVYVNWNDNGKTTFKSNKASTDDGGAIFSQKNVYVKNSEFIDNYAADYGGAIYTVNNVYVDSSSFSNNYAAHQGGAIYTQSLTLKGDNSFIENKAKDSGGALYIARFAGKCSHVIFIGNVAGDDGGAIYVNRGSDPVIESCYFKKNQCGDEGGAVYVDDKDSHLTLRYNIFTQNSAGSQGQSAFNCGYYSAITNNWWDGNNPSTSNDQVIEWKAIKKNVHHVDSSPLTTGLTLSKSSIVPGEIVTAICYFYESDGRVFTGYLHLKDAISFTSASAIKFHNVWVYDSYATVDFTAESLGNYIISYNIGSRTYVQFLDVSDSAHSICLNAFGNSNISESKDSPSQNYFASKRYNDLVDVKKKLGTSTIITDAVDDVVDGMGVVDDSVGAGNGFVDDVVVDGMANLDDDVIDMLGVSDDLNSDIQDLDESVPIENTRISGDGSKNANCLIINANNMYASAEKGTFSELQEAINKNDVLNLTKDYTMQNKESSIAISKDLTINGNGHTLNADGKGTIFAINGGNVVLSNLILINGKAPVNGGAINVQSANSLKCDNVRFSNNYADDYGGAVYIGSTTSSTFTNCKFNDNKVDDHDGGAIYSKGVLTCINCDFSDNFADNYGGAIDVENRMNCTNCTFRNNKADDHNGGAIYSASLICIESCKFQYNYASDRGGAIYANNEIKLSGYNEFIENEADNCGGAIYSRGDVHVNCDDDATTSFNANMARSDFGGAIYSEKNVYIERSNFTSNFANDDGGAINANGDVVIDSSNFYNNYADDDGGAIKTKGGLTIRGNNKFIGNEAHDYGGVIYSDGAVYINWDDNCTTVFSSNGVGNGFICNDGGVINAGKSIYVKNANFTDSYADDEGGVIYAWENLFIDSCNFSNNFAGGYGGVIFSRGDITIVSSNFTNNHASHHAGVLISSGDLTLRGYNNFIGNEAGDSGGAIFIGKLAGDITHTTFKNNKAGTDGGAIYINRECHVTFSECDFENNEAGDEGGAIYMDDKDSSVSLYHNNFVANTAKSGQTVYVCGKYDLIQANWHGSANPDFTDQFKEWRFLRSDLVHIPTSYLTSRYSNDRFEAIRDYILEKIMGGG